MKELKNKVYGNSGNSEVLRFITHPATVLDIGCGRGDNAILLKAMGCTIDGISISQDELDIANQHLHKSYLFNIEMGLPDEVINNKYDFIICSHVIEHICYPEQLLSDIRKCLKINGKLIVALPNLFHYSSRLKILAGNFEYESSGLWDDSHFRWYTYKTGKELLEKNGFVVLSSDVTGKVPAYSFFSIIFSEIFCTRLYNLFKLISPGLFGYQLLYTATPE